VRLFADVGSVFLLAVYFSLNQQEKGDVRSGLRLVFHPLRVGGRAVGN
jgi:hypothetical protein